MVLKWTNHFSDKAHEYGLDIDALQLKRYSLITIGTETWIVIY